jgi:single-stranded DNA-binding protein
MQNINEVTLLGELTGNLKLSFNGNEPYLHFTLATYEKLYNPLRKRYVPATELHDVVVYGELAIKLGQELSPGLQVYVRGKQKHTERGNQITEVGAENSGTAFTIGGLVSKKDLKRSQKKTPEVTKLPAAEQLQDSAEILVEESHRVAVICTGHISQDDALIMQVLSWNNMTERGRYWIQSTPNGWLLRIKNCCEWEQELKEKGISYYAIHNLKSLINAGFDWIHFDSGAQRVDGLVSWEW